MLAPDQGGRGWHRTGWQASCGHIGLPSCYGGEAPWRGFWALELPSSAIIPGYEHSLGRNRFRGLRPGPNCCFQSLPAFSAVSSWTVVPFSGMWPQGLKVPWPPSSPSWLLLRLCRRPPMWPPFPATSCSSSSKGYGLFAGVECGGAVGRVSGHGCHLGKIWALDLSCYSAESFWMCLPVSLLRSPTFSEPFAP